MSIIYEALKKLDKTKRIPQEETGENHTSGAPHRKTILIYIIAASIGFFGASYLFNLLSKKNQTQHKIVSPDNRKKLAKSAITPPAENAPVATENQRQANYSAQTTPKPAEPKPQPKEDQYVLNGVFFSQQDGYALINEQIVKEGDIIGNARVKRITLESVELDIDSSPLLLEVKK